ncbi:MAG: ABC transporter substrate-binding protein [Lachnospiraceae bacterium]|nr:ABC transporter substrate-binding protein [Lachnospiraceae bacterium]MBP1584387.1 ABC transporter substrate-binding protein [Lachnospiraceae bacterium]
MKRLSKILPLVTAAALMLTACGKQEEVPVESVLSDGILTVGLLNTNDRSCYPAEGVDGEPGYAGWEMEILKLIDHFNEDVVVEIRMANTRTELLDMLSAGEVDLAAGAFTRLDAYGSQYMLSDDYGYGSVYVINPRNGYLDTLAAFEDEVIGVSTLLSVTDVNKLTGIENVTQNPYSDLGMLAADIESGVVAAGICTESEMVTIVNGTDLQACEVRSGPQTSLVFLAQPGQDYLMRWVNWGINRHYNDMAQGIDSTEEES